MCHYFLVRLFIHITCMTISSRRAKKKKKCAGPLWPTHRPRCCGCCASSSHTVDLAMKHESTRDGKRTAQDCCAVSKESSTSRRSRAMVQDKCDRETSSGPPHHGSCVPVRCLPMMRGALWSASTPRDRGVHLTSGSTHQRRSPPGIPRIWLVTPRR